MLNLLFYDSLHILLFIKLAQSIILLLILKLFTIFQELFVSYTKFTFCQPILLLKLIASNQLFCLHSLMKRIFEMKKICQKGIHHELYQFSSRVSQRYPNYFEDSKWCRDKWNLSYPWISERTTVLHTINKNKNKKPTNSANSKLTINSFVGNDGKYQTLFKLISILAMVSSKFLIYLSLEFYFSIWTPSLFIVSFCCA